MVKDGGGGGPARHDAGDPAGVRMGIGVPRPSSAPGRALPMTALSVACPARGPCLGSSGADFVGVLMAVAPMAQALKVLWRVVQVVPVLVVNVTAAGFSAALTWL